MGTGRTVTWLVFAAAIAAAMSLAPGCGDADEVVEPGPPGGSSCARGGNACPVLCDSALGCVNCVTDADCGAAQPACVGGECFDCGNNSHCAMGQSCFPENHECQDSCSDNGDCDSGDAALCDPATAACLGCIDPGDCDADEVCSPVTGQCVECASSTDCGAGQPHCDVLDGQCRECLVDGNCGPSEFCRGNECVPGCSTDLDCDGDDPICFTATGSCVECTDAAHCPAAAPICDEDHDCVQCSENVHCTVPGLPICDGDECVECTDDEHCNAGFQCSSQECVPE
jgi:hypothetical protein